MLGGQVGLGHGDLCDGIGEGEPRGLCGAIWTFQPIKLLGPDLRPVNGIDARP